MQVSPHRRFLPGVPLPAVRILFKAALVLGMALVLFLGISAWRGSVFVAEAMHPYTVTVTAVDQARNYGAANAALTVTYTGFVSGDDETKLSGTLNCTTTAVASSPPGGYPITCNGLDATSTISPFYHVGYVSGTLTVNKAPLTVTADNKTKTYGSANPTFTVSYAGFVLSETATVLSGTLSMAATATDTSPVGNYGLTPSGLDSDNYAITYVDGTLTVTKLMLTVTADNKTKTYGAVNPTFTGSISGLLNSDTITATYTTTASETSTVGDYAITAALSDPDSKLLNYRVTNTPGTLTVNKAPLTVTADNKTKVYGSANPTFTVSYTGFVLSETATVLSGTLSVAATATDSSPVGSYGLTPSGLTSDNYAISYADGTLTVTKAPLTVTADNKTKVYGSANPTFTVSYTGFVLSETATVLSGTLSVAATATDTSPVGSYGLTPSGLTSDNYAISYADGTLAVTKAPLTVTADNKTKVYGSANPTFTVSYAGFVLSETATVLSGTLSVAATATDSSPVGSYGLTPSGLTSDNYAISYVAGTLTINAAPPPPPANRPPVAVDDAAQTPPGVPVTVTVLANDSDPDGDRLTVTGATSGDGTATVGGDGSITFTPAEGVVGTAAIDYTISDGRGGTASAQVLVTIPAPLRGRIDVTVRMVSGTPLSAVPLQLIDQAGKTIATGSTDSGGHHSFLDLPGGPMTVSATTVQAGVISTQVTVVLGQTVHALLEVGAPSTLAVSPSPRSILGNGTAASRITAVLTDQGGSPVPGVLVSFETSAGTLLAAAATTDAAGRAEVELQSERLAGLVSKDAVIIARATDPGGYQVQAQTTVTFTPAAITGIVTDRTTGKPVPNATVEVSEDFDGDGIHDFAASATTDQDGRYVIFVPRGNWEYTPIISAPLQVGDRTITVRSRQKAQVGAIDALAQNFDGDKMVSGQLFATSPEDGKAVTPAQLFGNAKVSGLLRPAGGAEGDRPFTINSDGSFAVDAVPIGQYTMVFRIELPDTGKLAGVTIPVTVEKNGEINLTLGLIDPYGTVTDAVTGKVIVGADMRLFWADTAVNRSHGRVPHTLVQLPELPDFPPNQNHVPQPSSAAGEYAWMVWADGDYYIVAEAEGYETYDSREEGRTVPVKPGEDSFITDGIIHVGEAIVEYHLQMRPLGSHGLYIKGYPDGTFRPEGLITRAEIAAIFARLSAPTRPAAFGPGFADVAEKHWANEYTRLVRQLGLMTGDQQGMFRPEAPITRGEMAQVVQRFGGLTAGGAAPRDAVGHWAEHAIGRVMASGVMIGYIDGTFKPDQPLTRAEAVTTINRLVGRRPSRADRRQSWPDAPVSHWAFAEIEEASRGHRFARNADGSERFLTELELETW